MATFGYMVFLVRASVPHRPKELYRLSATGDDASDLLDVIEANLRNLGPGYHREEEEAEGYRVKEVTKRGRTIWVKVNKGPEGTAGEAFDLDTEESIETTVRQALLSGLRAMFVLPKDSYYGLLFVERIGRRNLRDTLNNNAVLPSMVTTGAVVRIEGFAEAADWQTELSDKQALRISEVLAVRDSGDDASTPNDTVVRLSVEGSRVAAASEWIKSVVTDRVLRRERRIDLLTERSQMSERRRNAAGHAFTVQDEEHFKLLTKAIADIDKSQDVDESMSAVLDSINPVNRAGLKHKRFEVSMGGRRVERTFSVERASLPQFVYHLGGYLPDGGLRDTWIAHAERIFHHRGVTLSKEWKG